MHGTAFCNSPADHHHQSSHSSHPHTCTPPSLAPTYFHENRNHYGGHLDPGSYTAGYYVHLSDSAKPCSGVDPSLLHKAVNEEQLASLSMKRSCRDGHHHHNAKGRQDHYLHHERGLTDINNCSSSKVHPIQQQQQQQQQCLRSTPSSDEHCWDKTQQDSPELLHGVSGQQLLQMTYDLKIGHASGAKYGHSTNKREEPNELNKANQGCPQLHSLNENRVHPSHKVSSRHQVHSTIKTKAPSPNKSKADSQLRHHSSHRSERTRPEYSSGVESHSWLSSKEYGSPLKLPGNAIYMETDDSGVLKHAASPPKSHQDALNRYNQKTSPYTTNTQQDLDLNYHVLEGSHSSSFSEEISERVEEHKHDTQTPNYFSPETQSLGIQDENIQSLGDQDENVQKQANQRRYEAQQQKYNAIASKLPQPRKATQKPNRVSVPVRKRSATFPPSRTKHSRQTKTDNKKTRPRVYSGSHIPVPGASSHAYQRTTNFTKLRDTNQHIATAKGAAQEDKFSRRLPLPPIGSDADNDNTVKKNSTRLREPATKSHPQATRPSTRQSKHETNYRQLRRNVYDTYTHSYTCMPHICFS